MDSDEELLDDTWITEIENEEKDYNNFYKEENTFIETIFIYVNNENKIYYIKKDNIFLQDKCLNKEELLFLIKKNQKYNNNKHKLISILQYNIDLNPQDLNLYLKNSDNFNFLSIKSSLSELKWDDTIHLFKDLNSLYIIYYENQNKKNSNTKKVYINNTKRKKTRRKR